MACASMETGAIRPSSPLQFGRWRARHRALEPLYEERGAPVLNESGGLGRCEIAPPSLSSPRVRGGVVVSVAVAGAAQVERRQVGPARSRPARIVVREDGHSRIEQGRTEPDTTGPQSQ